MAADGCERLQVVADGCRHSSNIGRVRFNTRKGKREPSAAYSGARRAPALKSTTMIQSELNLLTSSLPPFFSASLLALLAIRFLVRFECGSEKQFSRLKETNSIWFPGAHHTVTKMNPTMEPWPLLLKSSQTRQDSCLRSGHLLCTFKKLKNNM